MIAPTLIVGLGGTGSKIVKRVSDLVTEEQRRRIGFAVFDTDINELNEIKVESPFIHTIQTSTKLSVGEYLNIDTHARDTWFPVNAILNSKALTEGAGQVRAISRLALETAIRAGNMEPLHEAIDELYKLEEEQTDQALRVIIVSSLAGGTGSGILLPVALYIKNYLSTKFQQSSNITRGFFILPEVFYEVIKGESERNNLRCNAYATLRELDAFLMKGDSTLPEKYKNTVKIEFPRLGSNDFDEYNIRPYDFCFLFDAQNTEGKKLNSFNQYLDHAANCIYSQSIGPMNKRSNSSEDNTIRELCAENGRNRYAGAGSSMLIYPYKDIKQYIALQWTKECVSDQWLTYDKIFKEKCINNSEQRAQGYSVKDPDPADDYVTTVNQLAEQKNAFAMSIQNQCWKYDESGLVKEISNWDLYVDALKKFIEFNVGANQTDLGDQKNQAMALINDISGGSDTWEQLQEAFYDMDKYRRIIIKRSEDTARTIAYSIFKAKNDSVTKEKLNYQLETYLRDSSGSFIHPNAVRYFLYQSLKLLTGEKSRIENEIRDAEKYYENFYKNFDDPDTEDDEETVEQLSDRKVKLFYKLFNKMDPSQEELKEAYITYMKKCDEYRLNLILKEVMLEGIEYIKSLCDAFKVFYTSFENKLQEIDSRIRTIYKKYNHQSGKTARYVCASPVCLDKMTQKMPYTGATISIDSQLSDDIYMKVRNYSMLRDKPDSKGFFNDIFDNGIIGYFENKLTESYSLEIDMDIISALEKEAIYEYNKVTDSEIRKHVEKVIDETRKLSNPFIERPLGEQKAPISACAYNKKLNPKDDSPKCEIIEKELNNFGGTSDEDIPLNMIMFYQSIYGLRANKLSKFAPGGEYFKAYFELTEQIKPKSDETPVITPHIDANWHIVSAMPDLDEQHQKETETKIYKSFLLGFLYDQIDYIRVSEGKFLYKLRLDNCDSETFVVSNKTPCDHFYEVLDALTINPVIVNNIVEECNRLFRKELNGASKADFETSYIKNKLDNLELKEFNKEGLTLFDLAILLKVSSPCAEFDKSVGSNIMRVMLETVYNFIKAMTSDNELNNKYGEFVFDQYLKFSDNISWYLKNWKDNFSEYIDDMIIVACGTLKDHELDNLVEKIKVHRKQADKNMK